MLARWNGEGEFESIFKKKGVSVSDEANNIFGRIESLDEFNMPINAEEWDKWAKSIKLTDDSLKKFLTTKDEAYQTKDLATYTQYLKDQNKTLDIAAVKTKALAFAKNMAINAGIAFASFLVSKGIQALVDWANRAEIAREKSTELTKAWSEENSSIDSSISKYKQLKESLDSGTLSTQEIANAKNELAEIQDTLTSKYGQEALGIDLVNGKYDEQIKKLDELSRKKAEDYTAENYANIQEDIKYVNNSVKVDEELGSGAVFNPDTYNKYIKKYLDEYDALTTRVTDRNGIVGSSGLNIVGEGTREEIYNQLTSLFNDLSRDFGEDNPDVNKLKTALSGIISDSFDTEKMEQAKSNIKQYAEAQILSQNNTRQLYEDAINAVDNYNKALASGQGVEEAKANLDEVKQKVADNTSGISGAGQVFEDVWGGISEGAKTTSENLNEMTVSITEMASAAEGLSKIGTAMKELGEDGRISLDSIAEIKEAVGSSIDNWEDYENILLNAKAGSKELNDALSDLTYATLESKFASVGLANATEEQIAKTLEEAGVTNNVAVAHDMLMRAKAKEIAVASTQNNVKAESIAKLIDETNMSEADKLAMYDLVAAEIYFNNNTLDVKQKVQALYEVARAAGVAAAAIISVDDLSAATKKDKKGKYTDSSYDKLAEMEITYTANKDRTDKNKTDSNGHLYHYNGKDYEKREDAVAAAAYDSANKGIDKKAGKPSAYTPTTPLYSTKKSSKDTSADDAKKKAEAAEKARIEAFKEGLEARADILDRYKAHIDALDFGLDILSEEDFEGQFDVLTLKLEQATEYGKELKEEFERAASTMPSTAEEAEALGSHLENLGSDIRNNIKDIREMTVALEKAKIGMLSNTSKNYLDEMSKEISSLEKRIEILRADDPEDFKYTNQILNMQMFLPNQSGINKRIREKSKEDREIIKMEQETQDELDSILRTQIEKNEKLRADEKAKLIEGMEELRVETQTKIDEVQAAYEYSLKENEQNTQDSCDNIADMIDSTDVEFPEPSIDFSKAEKQFNDFGKVVDKLEGKASDLAESLAQINNITGAETPNLMPGNKKTSSSKGGMPFDDPKDAKEGIDGKSKALENFDEQLKVYEEKIDEWLDQHSGDGYPFAQKYPITSFYGYRLHPKTGKNKFHSGVDFGAGYGTKILSVGSGTVTSSGANGGYGNCIIIKDATGHQWLYAHMAEPSHLKVGDKVSRGQHIGFVGSTGISTGPHLHLERRDPNGATMDPLPHLPYYAMGTPKGNALAKNIGIAGENYKSEILVDKSTGEMEFIDTPTLIDTSKTDVIGEKATARLPKFAEGTYRFGYISAKYETGGWDPGLVSSGEGDYGGISYGLPQFSTTTGSANAFVKWLKEVNLEIGNLFEGLSAGTKSFGEAWEKAYEIYGDTFGSLQQQYAYEKIVKPKIDSVLEKYGVDLTRSPALLEMAYSTIDQYGDIYPFENINKDMTDEQIVTAVYDYKAANVETNFRGSKTEVISAIKNNRIPNERKDVESLLGKTWEDVGGFPDSLAKKDSIKETPPEIKRLEEITKPFEDLYDSVDKIYKSEVLAANNRFNMAEHTGDNYTELDYATDIYKAAEKKANEVLKNGTQAYNDVLWEYNNYMDVAKKEGKTVDPKIIQAFEDALEDLGDAVVDTEKDLNTFRSSVVESVDDSLSEIDDIISNHDFYDSWDKSEKTKLEYISDKQILHDKSFQNGLISEKEYQKRSEGIAKERYTAEREQISENLNEIDRYNNHVIEGLQAQIEVIDRQIQKRQSLLQIKQKEYDIDNKLADAQTEIDKAIANSLISTKYLNDRERAEIFNLEDYEYLSGKIKSIQSSTDNITNKFYKRINSLGEDELYLKETITAEYERQLASKERELEIAKAEVDLKKKQQILDNVLAEKNVKFLNEKGNWEWIAAQDKVQQATADVIESKAQMERLQTQNSQQRDLDNRQKYIDDLNSKVGMFNQQIDKINKETENLKKVVENVQNPIKDLGTIFTEFKDTGVKSFVEGLNDILTTISESTGETYDFLSSESFDTIEASGGGIADASQMANLNGNRWGGGSGESLAAYIKRIKNQNGGYAGGTRHATPGLHEVDELGDETYITSDGIFKKFTGGEVVLNNLQTERLYEMVNLPNPLPYLDIPKINSTQTIGSSQNFYGGITVVQPTDFNDFVRQLTNKIRNH